MGSMHNGARPRASSLAWVAATLAWAAGSSIALAADAPRISVVIPYSSSRFGTPAVEVSLEKGPPLRFLVDTGAAASFISAKAVEAQRLRLVKAKDTEEGKDLNLSWLPDADLVRVASCSIGGANGGLFSDVPFLVLPAAKAGLLDSLGVDGILGINFLSSVAMVLNPDRQELALIYPGNITRRELDEAGFSGSPVSLEKLSGGGYGLRMRVEADAEETAILDTGGQFSQISKATAKRLKLDPLRRIQVSTLLGSVPQSRAVASVTIGEVTAALRGQLPRPRRTWSRGGWSSARYGLPRPSSDPDGLPGPKNLPETPVR